MVMQVFKENGDPVKRGDLLVRLDDTAIRDALASAEAAERAAAQALDQANRQLDRLKTLRLSGMATAQSLEDTEIRRNTAQSEAEAAKARVVSARQQLARTEVRAPFDGLVSDRKVSAGDTAQVGKELMKVIDPGSLRFEGLVSADHVGTVKAAQSVHFHVNGYGDKEFAGRVRRVNPAANATTRQVEVLVDLVGDDQPKLAGLYAEGRIETETSSHLLLPASSLVREGDRSFAWAIRDGAVHKVAIVLGDRDPRSGSYVVVQGLSDGERLLKYPTALLKDGRRVQAAEAGGSQGR
jgi:RND family efflux transporter MFP subunit